MRVAACHTMRFIYIRLDNTITNTYGFPHNAQGRAKCGLRLPLFPRRQINCIPSLAVQNTGHATLLRRRSQRQVSVAGESVLGEFRSLWVQTVFGRKESFLSTSATKGFTPIPEHKIWHISSSSYALSK